MRLTIAAALLVVVSGVAAAEIDNTSGNYWYQICSGSNLARCYGYLNGISDADALHAAMGAKGRWCMPDNVTAEQLRAVVVAEMDRRPEVRHKHFIAIVDEALRRAFPCGRK
jgi:hypothetical protein